MTEDAIIAGKLTCFGYKPEVAGAEAFNKSVKAILDAQSNHRGILVVGNVGCGKTTFAEAAAKILFGVNSDYKFVECGVRSSMDKLLDPPDRMYELLNEYLVLDDIGSEDVWTNYADKRDRIAELLTEYVRIWQRINNAMPIIITTNLSLEKLAGRYGARLVDRLLGVVCYYEMLGTSKRKMWIV